MAAAPQLRAAIEANPPQPTQQTPGQEYRSSRLLERGRVELFNSFTFAINASGLTVASSGSLTIGPVRAHQRYRVRLLSGVVSIPAANQNTVSLQSVALQDPRTNNQATPTLIPCRISGFTALAQQQGFSSDDFNLDSDDEISLLAQLVVGGAYPNFLQNIEVVLNNSAATTPTITISWLLEVERFLYDGIFLPTP